MKSYLKLVNFEISRFFKLYLILIGLIIVSQIIGAVVVSTGFMNNVERAIVGGQISAIQFVQENGSFSFHRFIDSGWFILPIVFSIAMLMIYVFFIWYRDWVGKNTFIYRLLMLPTTRLNLYLAKLTAIMLLVLGLIALQLLLMPIELQIVNSIVHAELRTEFSLIPIYDYSILYWLYPNSFIGFIVNYGLGLIFVAVVFTSILFERSYRLLGIFFAIVYGMLSFGVLMLPIIIDNLYTNYFYPTETFFMLVAASIVVFGSAIWIANHLLKHKIRV